jgi:tetraacyldisaccharide 4'-kinase
MRARLESVLNDTWYGDRSPGLLLRALEGVYLRMFAAARNREIASRAVELEGMPIIVVGNITAGGSGKTPLVIHLCRLLTKAGLEPGVVSRGYGRRGRAQLLVNDRHGAAEVGEEPLLIHRRCGISVMVGPDRASSARELLRMGTDLVISDDGLQRLRMPRALEICVVDGARGFGNGRHLPAGPLREGVARLDTVDYVICNGAVGKNTAIQGNVLMHLEPGAPRSLDGQEDMSMEELVRRSRQAPVAAVAGIGNPGRFFGLLEKLGVVARHHPFPDHHRYSAGDFERLKGALILMTEKDSVRCADLGLQNAWCLPVDAHLPASWEDEFVGKARELVMHRGGIQ